MVWSKNESRMGYRRMIDREKVITGLELCTNISPDGCLMLCPYKDEKDETYSGFCEQVLKQDALALLKEQDGKPMIENERGWNCPSCGMNLIGKTASGYPCDLIDLPEDEPIHFCPMCGQAVIWE